MAAPIAASTYDEVPYRSYSFPEAHPDRMATVAHLFGLTPTSPAKARVLELGCASGGNLAPMAALYPSSQFLGIDLSKSQIDQGKEFLAPLGLDNLEIRNASILDVDESYGKFDYIIAHGVYSWVPEQVQNKILAICRDNLTPNGVAYISYNTLPGWHMRGMIRDMMIYHTRRFRGAKARIDQARALLDFLTKSVSGPNQNAYSSLLKMESEFLKQSDDWYLYHEHLEEVNAPIYFYQFVDRAQAHGLKFLGETMVRQMVPGNYPKEVEQVLQRLGPDIISMEQYMDFLRNRLFRHTLLCLPQHNPQYTLNPDRLLGLHIASPVIPDGTNLDLTTGAQVTFKMPWGPATVQVSEPLSKNAIMILSERFPASVPFEELCLEARKRFSPHVTPDEAMRRQDRQMIGHIILQSYVSVVERLVELRRVPVPVVTKVSAKPVVTPLARRQAATQTWVTSLKHDVGNLGEFERNLVRMLDGEHDRNALHAALTEMVLNGRMHLTMDGARVTEPEKIRETISSSLDQVLDRLMKLSYLVG
jgi:methyltransferase-like protein